MNTGAACACERRVDTAIARGRVNPRAPLFAGAPRNELEAQSREVERLHEIADVFHPRYAAPDRLVESVRRVLESGRFRILN